MKDEATEAGKQKARLNIPAGTLAIIPLRNRVLFPSMMMPLSVNKQERRQIVEEAVRQQMPIGFVTLRDTKAENPAPSDLYKVGTAADVLRVFSLPDGQRQVLVQGRRRFEIAEFIQTEPALIARVTMLGRKLTVEELFTDNTQNT